MKRNQSYEIRPCENGYVVENSWSEPKGEFSNYQSKKFIFSTWEEVSDWVKNNSIEIPPQ